MSLRRRYRTENGMLQPLNAHPDDWWFSGECRVTDSDVPDETIWNVDCFEWSAFTVDNLSVDDNDYDASEVTPYNAEVYSDGFKMALDFAPAYYFETLTFE